MRNLLVRAMTLALCLPLAAPAPAEAPAAPAAIPQLSAGQWQSDLRFMAAEMRRRHKNLHHTVAPAAFDAAVEDLHARIPGLRRNQIVVGLMRIAALVGDGHTRVDPRKDPKFGFRSLPLKLYLFDDGLYVRAAAPQHAALIGARVEAIGGVPVEEAIRRLRPIVSVDNEMGYRKFASIYLNMPDILHALGLSPRSDAALLQLRQDGRSWTETVEAGAVEPLWPPDTDVSLVTPDGWADARKAPQPLWLQAPLDYHRLVPLAHERALYAQINMVTGIEGQSFAAFGEKIRREAERTSPRAILLDFRLAHGGNHDLRHGFIRQMVKAEDEDTRLFVLVRRGSYSATEAILVDLDLLTDAVFLGEPASSKPNSYGDSYKTAMPGSGISIRTSIQWNQLKGQSQEPWTAIDAAIPYNFADYAAGRDPVLGAALAYAPGASLHDRLLAAARSGGAPAVLREVASYRADPVNRYQHLGLSLPRAAAWLNRQGRPEEAFAAADYAARQFPDSVDAWTILTHLADATKRPAIALHAGRRVLALHPNDRFARPIVERLEKAAQ